MESEISTVKILERLKSRRRNDIIDSLSYLRSSRDIQSDQEILEKILQLISHSDADIRELAASTAGIHLRLKEAANIFLIKIRHQEEKDQLVLATMSAALSTLVICGKANKCDVNTALTSVVLNENFDPELRGTAYLSLLRINNKISVSEYAASPCDLEKMNYDPKWVYSL